MNFFPFLRLGIIKKLEENVVLIRKSKIMIFECAVTCYRTLFIMTDIMTKTKTITKTNTFREQLQRAIQETCDL